MSSVRRIPLAEPYLPGNARRYVDECFDTNFVSSVGPFVERFEREFAHYVGSRYAVACASGTAAIHVAMRLLAVGPEDEVPVSTLTFIASANPIVYEGGRPLLVDSEPRTWNLDGELLAKELKRRADFGERLPRVVEVVHILGQPADLEPLLDACERYELTLIEDAAEALGARYVNHWCAGRHVGTIGRVGCFSFNGNKVITTGGGGMLVTDDEGLARRAKHLTTQARLPASEYQHDEVGYNYRMTNVAAALGVAQLESLPSFLESKRRIARAYDSALSELEGLTPPPRLPWSDASYWLYTVRIDPKRAGFDRREAQAQLAEQGIETRPIWTPLHTTEAHRGLSRLGGPVSEGLFEQCLSLPCSVSLAGDDLRRVVDGLVGLHSRRRAHR